MYSAKRFLLFKLLSAAVPAAMVLLGASGAMAQCRHDDYRCRRDSKAYWRLHRPSTPAERAETKQLNSEYRQTIAAPALLYDDGLYQREQQRYDRELREYQAAQQRYDLEMRGPRPRYGAYGPPGRGPGRQAYARPMRHHPVTAEELDNDPFAPTGGTVDDRIAAPTPGLDGSTTGLTQFNAWASGLVPTHPYRDPYYPPPPRYPY
jgi:hypothetical protein